MRAKRKHYQVFVIDILLLSKFFALLYFFNVYETEKQKTVHTIHKFVFLNELDLGYGYIIFANVIQIKYEV